MDEAKRVALSEAKVVLCSACLLGFKCRYDGRDKKDLRVERALAGKDYVPFCPEEAGGLPTPRPPADLSGGTGGEVLDGRAKVRTREGADVTDQFRRGAQLALETAQRYGAGVALLKEGSPSCGSRRVWQDGGQVQGQGVAAAALTRAGVAVISEEELP